MITSIKTASLLSLAVAPLLAMPAAAQAIDPAALAEPCAGCHGTDGSSLGAAPTIANLTVDYFVVSMKDYASGARAATVMGRIAKGYSEAELRAMAEYFDQKPFTRVAQSFDAALAAQGKDLQARYCENCHEKDGHKSDGIGVLAGQRLPYLAYSIEDFKGGRRALERRKKQKMDELWSAHGDGGYQAVLHYYASQDK